MNFQESFKYPLSQPAALEHHMVHVPDIYNCLLWSERGDVPLAGGATFFGTGTGTFSSGTAFFCTAGTLKTLFIFR